MPQGQYEVTWIVRAGQAPNSSTASARTVWPYLFYILGFHVFAEGNYAAESILKTPEQHDFKTPFRLTEKMSLVFLTSL